tara:strand:+ start:101 stop:238 length:138 start_codon:yes stop_codon:yes gene_type:complete
MIPLELGLKAMTHLGLTLKALMLLIHALKDLMLQELDRKVLTLSD